ncbi:hypothetical protein CIG19_16625 [Enterobacterales bacterium CwR94]|nr:hypothetical protein CIG19_16625 [Enterobacterales bacterium CwR94]
MIWIMLVTLVGVFIVGFRLLTANARHASQALSKRLQLPPVHVESMLSMMGKTAAQEFTDYLKNEGETPLHNAAIVLLIWQVFIVDDSDGNQQNWYRILTQAGFSALISRQQLLLAMGFLRQLEPEQAEMNLRREQYNARFTAGVEVDAEPETNSNVIALNRWRDRH